MSVPTRNICSICFARLLCRCRRGAIYCSKFSLTFIFHRRNRTKTRFLPLPLQRAMYLLDALHCYLSQCVMCVCGPFFAPFTWSMTADLIGARQQNDGNAIRTSTFQLGINSNRILSTVSDIVFELNAFADEVKRCQIHIHAVTLVNWQVTSYFLSIYHIQTLYVCVWINDVSAEHNISNRIKHMQHAICFVRNHKCIKVRKYFTIFHWLNVVTHVD